MFNSYRLTGMMNMGIVTRKKSFGVAVPPIIFSEPVLAVISEFMDERCSANHLVASFYMKIVCQLLSKHPEKVFFFSNLLKKIIVSLLYYATADLLVPSFNFIFLSYRQN